MPLALRLETELFKALTAGLLLLLLSSTPCLAAQSTTNGLDLVVHGIRKNKGPITNDTIRFDDKLLYQTFCKTGKVELQMSTDHAYDIRLRMIDKNGRTIAPTSLGKTFGSRYGESETAKNRKVAIHFAWGAYEDNPYLGGGKFLPSPQDLFHMKQPGGYTIEIEMKMIRVEKFPDNTTRSRSVVYFPVLKLKVEKPPDSD